jgi:hypothetical protein
MKFIRGLKLSEYFFKEAVKPLLSKKFKGLKYSAAHLGRGSDVLGFDTPQSMDHHWGPKTDLFLTPGDLRKYKNRILKTMAYELPLKVRGLPTHFEDIHDDGGHLTFTDQYPIEHGVRVFTVKGFFKDYLSIDPLGKVSESNWLGIPQQHLSTIRYGKVFQDDLNRLNRIKRKLYWYPRDIWLYLLACQWRKIDQEEPFMGRCGQVGDELGSRVIAARQVVEIMRLCFLMEREYAPYPKWFGSGFNKLKWAGRLTPIFHEVFDARTWQAREKHLTSAYLAIGRMHNRLGITEKIPVRVSDFHKRPMLVPHSGRFVDALFKKVRSKRLKTLSRPVGSVNQFMDSTDALEWTGLCQQITSLFV